MVERLPTLLKKKYMWSKNYADQKMYEDLALFMVTVLWIELSFLKIDNLRMAYMITIKYILTMYTIKPEHLNLQSFLYK